MKDFRNNGAIGALLDEYEKAILELQAIIQDLPAEMLTKVFDKDTKDKDCLSIQSILSHVVQSGYTYVIEIRKSLGEELPYRPTIFLATSAEYQEGLEMMFQYNEKLFEDYPNIVLDQYDPSKKIKVRWGQLYDVEQLFEHAIVHILRHRRQIEKFLQL